MTSKEEIVAEYNRQLHEIDKIRQHHQERVAAQNEMSYYLVMIAASGYPNIRPKSFTYLKSQCDEIRTREEKIGKEIEQAENELAVVAYWISTLD